MGALTLLNVPLQDDLVAPHHGSGVTLTGRRVAFALHVADLSPAMEIAC